MGSRVTSGRVCACGCGRELPPGSRADRRYFNDRCRERAYYRRKVASAPKPEKAAPKPPTPKPEPSFLPKRKRPSPQSEETRRRQRLERIGERLEQVVARHAAEFREGRA